MFTKIAIPSSWYLSANIANINALPKDVGALSIIVFEPNIIAPSHDYQTGTRFEVLGERERTNSVSHLLFTFYNKFVIPIEEKYNFVKNKKTWDYIFSGINNAEGENVGKEILTRFLSEIDNLKQLLELLKRDYPIFYELFQCYFYSKEGLILKKTKIEDLIEKFENFINKAIALLEKYVNLSVDYLANDNLNFKELKKLIEKLKKVVGNELNHLFTIKTRLTQLKNAFSLIKFEELAFSKEALKSIKDLLGREGEVQKYLLSLIQNLLIEGNETRQIDVFNKINGIDIAKYPRGHKNLRLIIHYNYFKEGILFILDVVEHDKKYEQWHNEIKLDNYLKVGLKLTKVELAFSLYEKDCQKIIAKIITNHHLP